VRSARLFSVRQPGSALSIVTATGDAPMEARAHVRTGGHRMPFPAQYRPLIRLHGAGAEFALHELAR